MAPKFSDFDIMRDEESFRIEQIPANKQPVFNLDLKKFLIKGDFTFSVPKFLKHWYYASVLNFCW